jgi:hypothetical protein
LPPAGRVTGGWPVTAAGGIKIHYPGAAVCAAYVLRHLGVPAVAAMHPDRRREHTAALTASVALCPSGGAGTWVPGSGDFGVSRGGPSAPPHVHHPRRAPAPLASVFSWCLPASSFVRSQCLVRHCPECFARSQCFVRHSLGGFGLTSALFGAARQFCGSGASPEGGMCPMHMPMDDYLFAVVNPKARRGNATFSFGSPRTW